MATDVLSRGIDVEGIAWVINFDMPFQVCMYLCMLYGLRICNTYLSYLLTTQSLTSSSTYVSILHLSIHTPQPRVARSDEEGNVTDTGVCMYVCVYVCMYVCMYININR